jgi:hypothetical protein
VFSIRFHSNRKPTGRICAHVHFEVGGLRGGDFAQATALLRLSAFPALVVLTLAQTSLTRVEAALLMKSRIEQTNGQRVLDRMKER